MASQIVVARRKTSDNEPLLSKNGAAELVDFVSVEFSILKCIVSVYNLVRKIMIVRMKGCTSR